MLCHLMVIASAPSSASHTKPSRLSAAVVRARTASTVKKIENSRCEINVVEHCNLSCRSCSHLSPLMPRTIVSAEQIAHQLGLLGRVYHARWVRLVGGEPLLHPHLIDVIEAARGSRVADRVSVVTNGVLLARMDNEFWRAIDAIEVSLYPGKTLDRDARARFTKLARMHDVDLRLVDVGEFRESFSTRGTDDDRLVRRIYSRCEIAHVWRCHTVADGYFYKCSPAYFLPKAVPACASYDKKSGVEISDSDGFAVALHEYLDSPDPLPVCRNCLGTAGKRFAHEQVRRANFITLQDRPVEELVDFRRLWASRLSPVRLRVVEGLARLPFAQSGRRLK
jgi:organic radical activating enzyme